MLLKGKDLYLVLVIFYCFTRLYSQLHTRS
nr:MAG TPA: hypothetical protein [Caudoviricetes sp.]